MLKEKFLLFKDRIVNNASFTLKEQLGYAGGIFGNAMGQDSIDTFDDIFIRTYMFPEKDYGFITIIENILMIFGFITPPVAGSILDTPARPGKKTPSKIMAGIMPIPFAITSLLLFIVPFNPLTNSFGNFIWFLVFKLIFKTVDTFYDLSLNTISLRMTNNADDRKNFYTVATLAASLGSMLPGWVIPVIVDTTEDPTKQKQLYFVCALIFAVVGLGAMIAPYFTLDEKLKVVKKPEKAVIVWDRQTISTLLHCRSFIILELATFFEQVRQLSYKLLNYMYRDVFGDYKMKVAIDAISGGLSYAGLAAVPFLGKKFSARTILSGGFGYTGIFYAIMSAFAFGINKNSFNYVATENSTHKVYKYKWIVGVLIGLAGMPNNAISTSKKIIVGDATDYMEWYSEKTFGTPIRSEGLVSAAQSVFNNIFNLIRTNFYNISFQKIGYKSAVGENNVEQKVETIKKIFLLFGLCGVVGNFLASGSYLFDNYTGKKKTAILAELEEMRAAREKLAAEFNSENVTVNE